MAFIFSGNGTGVWSQSAVLKPADGASNDGFAGSLSLYRELAGGYETLFLASGAAAVNKVYMVILDPRDGQWRYSTVLQGPDGSQFGWVVGAYEDSVAVGAPRANGEAGGVYVYTAQNVSNRIAWLLESSVSNA